VLGLRKSVLHFRCVTEPLEVEDGWMGDSRSAGGGSDSLGDRVRHLRRQRGWTQDQLATEAKVSKSFISEVETSESQPRGPVLVRIATALRASLDYLMTGKERAAALPSTLDVPIELASLARRRGITFSHVELLLEFHNSIEGMRRDQPPLRPTEQEWEEFYNRVQPHIEKALRGRDRGDT
jgi:transcriptional regulator with XRE-family HTH domain